MFGRETLEAAIKLQKREKLQFFRGNKSFDYLLIQFEGELKHLLKRLQFIKKEVCHFVQKLSMYERTDEFVR